MKKSLCFTALVFAALASDFLIASAQAVTSPSASASVSIVTPLTITRNADLVFGSWAAGASQSYRINADATGTTTGATGQALTVTGVTRSAARFTANGAANGQVTWSFPASITVTSSSGTLTVTPVLPAGATGSNLNTTLDATGASSVFMGGSIATGTTAPTTGQYTGSFTVQANYQ